MSHLHCGWGGVASVTRVVGVGTVIGVGCVTGGGSVTGWLPIFPLFEQGHRLKLKFIFTPLMLPTFSLQDKHKQTAIVVTNANGINTLPLTILWISRKNDLWCRCHFGFPFILDNLVWRRFSVYYFKINLCGLYWPRKEYVFRYQKWNLNINFLVIRYGTCAKS